MELIKGANTMADNNIARFFHVLRRAVAQPQARIEVLESLLKIMRATAPFSEDTKVWIDGALECAAEDNRAGMNAALEMAYLFAREEIEEQAR